MAWRVDGIGNTYRHAAADAARRVGVPLGQWLERVVLDHPRGPTREESDRQITAALEALESRIEQSSLNIGAIIEPLKAQVDRLESVSERLRHEDTEGQARARRELDRQTARLDSLAAGAEAKTQATDTTQPDPEASNRDPWTRHRPHDAHALPDLVGLRRRRFIRYAGGLGAVILIAGSIAAMIWVVREHDATLDTPAIAQPTTTPRTNPSADQTPPPGVAGIGANAVLPATPSLPAGTLPTTTTALVALRARAESNDAQAQYLLGLALLQGSADTPNPREGGEWLAAAAVAGHAEAQLQLGRLYARGAGLPRDAAQAFFWTQSAAERGITEAEYELGLIYSQGLGVGRSHALAARWFRLAGAKNHADALFQLGLIFELGLDYRANRQRALEWYDKAAKAGSAAAADKLAKLGSATATAPAAAAIPTAAPAAAIPSAAPKGSLSQSEVTEIQRLLKSLDFDPGPVNGRLGARTAEAIRQFQTMAGGNPDGAASADLLKQLRDIAGPARR